MKQVGDYIVQVHREPDPITGQARAVGSRISGPKGTFKVSHWPTRITGIEESGDHVLVKVDAGSRPYLTDDNDRLSEAQIAAAESGGDAGRDPHHIGQLRYLVHGYSGTQAQLAGKFVEAGLQKELADRMAGWVSRQSRAMARWRGPTSAQRESDPVVLARALQRAPARLTNGVPALPEGFLESFLTAGRVQLAWPAGIGETAIGGDPFVTLAEYDARRNAESLVDTEAQLREEARWQGDCGPLVGRWLALHGDSRALQESDPVFLNAVAERVVRGTGPLRPRSDLDQRVIEAQLVGVLREEDPTIKVGKGEGVVNSTSNRVGEVTAPVIAPANFTAEDGVRTSEAVEADARVKPGDMARCGHKIRKGRRTCPHCGTPYDDGKAPLKEAREVVKHLAIGPWSATIRRASESGWAVRGERAPRAEVELFKEGQPTVLATFDDAGEAIAEAHVHADGAEPDPKHKCAHPGCGLPRGHKGPHRHKRKEAHHREARLERLTEAEPLQDTNQRQAPRPSDAARAGLRDGERALALGKEPPNLRRGHVGMRCGFCSHFEGGQCRLFDYYPVSAGELCDRYSKRITEAESDVEVPDESVTPKDMTDAQLLSAHVYHDNVAKSHEKMAKDEERHRRLARDGKLAGLRSKAGDSEAAKRAEMHRKQAHHHRKRALAISAEHHRRHLTHLTGTQEAAMPDPFLVESLVEDVLAESSPRESHDADARWRAEWGIPKADYHRERIRHHQFEMEKAHHSGDQAEKRYHAERLEFHRRALGRATGRRYAGLGGGDLREAEDQFTRRVRAGREARDHLARAQAHRRAGRALPAEREMAHYRRKMKIAKGEVREALFDDHLEAEYFGEAAFDEARWGGREYFGPERWGPETREDYDDEIRHHRRQAEHHERLARKHVGSERMYHHLAVAELHRARAKQFSRDVRHAQVLRMLGARHHREAEFAERGADRWMQGAVKHPGAFRAWLKKKPGEPVTDADIARGLASGDPHVVRMANLARTFRHARH